MNSKQLRKNRRFMIRKFNNLMDVFESQVNDWESKEHFTKEQVINDIRRLIRESKELKN